MGQEERIEYFMSEIARLSNQIVDLQDERDALAATVESLRKALLPFASTGLPTLVNGENYSVMHDRVKDWFGVSEFVRAIECFNKTPQQHLAERDAQKCRAWFIAGYYKMRIEFAGSLASSEGAEFAENQYADSIRQEKK